MAFSFQYYEMSYGLNIEMHKQVASCVLGGQGVCREVGPGSYERDPGLPQTHGMAGGLILKSLGSGCQIPAS